MDNLPIPNMRSSWVTALINAVIVFFFYYLILFGFLLNEYRRHFKDGQFQESKEQLVVWVDVPRYFYAAGPATVHIHVKNESRNLYSDVKIYLITDTNSPTLLLPSVFNANVYSSLVEFPVIEPLSTATGRTTFITQSNTSITSVLLKVGEEEAQQLSAIPEITFVQSAPKALQIDFLEHVLLPPWSNGFILALILLSTFLVRTDKEEKTEPVVFEPDQRIKLSSNWREEFVKDYLRSSLIFGAMVLITLIIYILLGSIDATIPLAGIIIFTLLILVARKHQTLGPQPSLTSKIIFFGFTFPILAGLLIYFNPGNFLSQLGIMLWILVGIEGLIAFFWYYSRRFTSKASQQFKESKIASSPHPTKRSNKK